MKDYCESQNLRFKGQPLISVVPQNRLEQRKQLHAQDKDVTTAANHLINVIRQKAKQNNSRSQ